MTHTRPGFVSGEQLAYRGAVDSSGTAPPGAVRTSLQDLAARARAGLLSPSLPATPQVSTAAFRRAAVMILFTPSARPSAAPGVDLFLVQRADHLRHHPGEIALPGGGIESQDTDDVAAALRELSEETGLNPDAVEVLGTLAPLPAPVSRHVVTPVLGWSDEVGEVTAIEPGEVRHSLRVPVNELLDPAARATVRIGDRQTAGFRTTSGWVWGFTGGVLDHLFTELGWTRPWDRAREVVMSFDATRRRIVVRG